MATIQEIANYIPTDIAIYVNPNIQNPIGKSHIYTISVSIREGMTSVEIPFPSSGSSDDGLMQQMQITWTQFKYVYTGDCSLKFSIVFKCSGQYIQISPPTSIQQRYWCSLTFPIPGINTDDIVLRIECDDMQERREELRIDLLGFTDLLPRSIAYGFMSENNNIKYLLTKNGLEDEKYYIYRDNIGIRIVNYEERLVHVYTTSYYMTNGTAGT